MRRFENHREAGRALGAILEPYKSIHPTVLALPRGGVPVAYEVARALDAPLDIFVIRKLGAPGNEELAMGALASGGVVVRNEDVIAQLGVTEDEMQAAIDRETREIARRESYYRDGEPAPIQGRTVIVVDDGMATGASMRVAIQALRLLRPRHIVVAVPVASREALMMARNAADDWACVITPQPFIAVGAWYRDFRQVSDDEVRLLLGRASQRHWVDEQPALFGAW